MSGWLRHCIKLTSNGTSSFRKNTHTDQYFNLFCFTPWSYKIAWFKSLVNRKYKIGNNDSLWSDAINNIMKFMSCMERPS